MIIKGINYLLVAALLISGNSLFGMYTYGLFDDPKNSLMWGKKLPKHEKELYEILEKDNHRALFTNSHARAIPDSKLGNYTLLTFALAVKSSKCADILITRFGAQVNKLDTHQLSPLVYALKHNNWEISQLLVDWGASVHLPQGQGFWGLRTPLWIFFRALCNGHYIWATYFTQQIEWLLRQGANPCKGIEDSLPLNEVCIPTCGDSKVSVKLTKLLCECGANTNERSYGCKTTLHHAVQRRKSESFKDQILIIHYLLQAGADINAQDENFYTPLHRAVICNEDNETSGCRGAQRTNADCIAYLLYKGADPKLKNCYWQKPIYYARQPEVIAMLENPKLVVLPERVKAILDPLKVACEKIP